VHLRSARILYSAKFNTSKVFVLRINLKICILLLEVFGNGIKAPPLFCSLYAVLKVPILKLLQENA